jgi:predicted molibdopterin-dependent oxidoreductase YjgC
MEYDGPEAVFDEMARLTASYGGMTYERLGIDGLQWPCLSKDHPGTPFLHKESFPRPGGRAAFQAIDYKDPAELPDEEYPFFLTTGRVFSHYHTGTMTRISPHLDAEQRYGCVDMHPEDARRMGLGQGDWVVLTSRRGSTEAPVRLTRTVRKGVLFMPIHFGESPANMLTSSVCDPIAKIPEFKVSAVRVEPQDPGVRRAASLEY